MGVIRGKVWHNVDWYPLEHHAGSPAPWRKCEKTGEWFDAKTGERVEIETLTLADLFERFNCPHCGREGE